MGGAAGRLGGALLVCAALAGNVPAARADGCALTPLTLGDAARAATAAIIVDVAAEKGDEIDGYTSTLRVRGTLKGQPFGPALALGGLGHPGGACDGGPRLLPGGRYVLLLEPAAGAPPGTAHYTPVGADEGVYALTAQGTRFPPDHDGGQPQLLPIPAAEFARDVGSAAGADPARIEAVIDALNLSEALDAPPATASTAAASPNWVPSRYVTLAAGLAVLVAAGVVALLWRPGQR